MRDSFGARVRRLREQRGISLAEIAEQTKIKASLLEGLERGDISQWPAGIFRRAYVRAYARAIGFDPDTAVREFLALHPDPVVQADVTPQPSPGRLRSFVGSIGTLLRRPGETAPPAPPSEPSDTVATVGTHGNPAPLALAVPPTPKPADEAASAPQLRRQPEAPRRQEPRLPSASSRPIEVARPAAEAATPKPAEKRSPDFLGAAKICTELGRVEDVKEVPPLLRDAAKILGARGLIVWVWDAAAEELKPALVHGYSTKVRSRLRGVSADADNVTSAAFRAAPLARSGALAVPLLGPSGSVGVLALELTDAAEQDADVRAMGTFFAAMLAQLVGAPPAGERREADVVPVPRAIEAAQPG
jgi:transcriptional regulator with XRE-family HTH domain